jgi:hypothetical protein
MKTTALIACIIFGGWTLSLHAQQKISNKIVSLPETKLWIAEQINLAGDFPVSEKGYLTGALFELKDTSILFSNKLVKEDYYKGNYTVSEIFVEDITLINTELPHTAKGFLLGLGIGASIGALVGFALGDSDPGLFGFTAGAKALYGSMALGAVGSIVGLMLGSVSLQIPLDGNVNMYQSKKAELERYTIKYSNK